MGVGLAISTDSMRACAVGDWGPVANYDNFVRRDAAEIFTYSRREGVESLVGGFSRG